MDRYENLANAIVLQAVKDYRSHLRYLSKHEKTEELIKKSESDRNERIEKIKAWKKLQNDNAAEVKSYIKKPVPPEYRVLSESERLMYLITRHEAGVKEVEVFFHSKWFRVLTALDAELLIERLREEFA